MPGPSPLVGYNTNVRHKGKLYHIQTEDSGVNHPHVITHLFADGGRIIASRKTAYAEHLGASDLASIVKRLMQEQHKAMFIELRDCVYDEQGAPTSAATAATASAKPASAAASAKPPSVPASAKAAFMAAPKPAGAAASANHTAQAAVAPVKASIAAMPAVAAPVKASVAAMPAVAAPAQPPPPPPPRQQRSLAPAAAAASAALGQASKPTGGSTRSLVPPIASIAGGQSTTAAMAAVAALQGTSAKASATGASSAGIPAAPRTAVPVPAPKFVGTPPPGTVPSWSQRELDADALDRAAEARLRGSVLGVMRGDAARRGAGRYQQTVAAKAAPQVSRAPTPRASTSFGGEALRGKSLDEVILSYLSDDAGDSER